MMPKRHKKDDASAPQHLASRRSKETAYVRLRRQTIQRGQHEVCTASAVGARHSGVALRENQAAGGRRCEQSKPPRDVLLAWPDHRANSGGGFIDSVGNEWTPPLSAAESGARETYEIGGNRLYGDVDIDEALMDLSSSEGEGRDLGSEAYCSLPSTTKHLTGKKRRAAIAEATGIRMLPAVATPDESRELQIDYKSKDRQELRRPQPSPVPTVTVVLVDGMQQKDGLKARNNGALAATESDCDSVIKDGKGAISPREWRSGGDEHRQALSLDAGAREQPRPNPQAPKMKRLTGVQRMASIAAATGIRRFYAVGPTAR